MALKHNVGGMDRSFRIVLGLVLMLLIFFGVFTGTLRAVAFVVGAIALVTGVLQYCPINQMLGINTCKVIPPPGE